MFNRKAYKEIARKQLKNRWTTPVLATLFVTAVMYIIQIPDTIADLKLFFNTFSSPSDFLSIDTWSSLGDVLSSNGTAFWSAGTIFPLIIFLITSVCTMANTYLYIVYSHTTEQQPFSVFIKGFSLWIKGLLGMLWFTLWTVLWSLLFLIPGIVKAFAYSQMFYILAEYPTMSVRKAMQISKTITKGNKGDLFVMALSFLGWEILAAFTCGIGHLWLSPYESMSFTNAYHAMKAHALQSGDITEADFEEAK